MNFESLILQPGVSLNILKSVIKPELVHKYMTIEYPGATYLWIATKKNRLDIVELLLEYGADPNRQCLNLDECYDEYPLHLASTSPQVSDILETLLNHGADPNVRMLHGVTPIFLALQNDNLEAVQLLIQAGADINLLRKDGTPPLFMVAQLDYKSPTLKWLVQYQEQEQGNNHTQDKGRYRINFNITNYENTSLLLHTVRLRRVENLQTLLQVPDLNFRSLDNRFQSIMTSAIKNEFLDIVEVLLDHGLPIAYHQIILLFQITNSDHDLIKRIMKKCTDPRIFKHEAIDPFLLVIPGEHWRTLINETKYWLPHREFHSRFPKSDKERIVTFLLVVKRIERSLWSRIQRDIRYKIIKLFIDY